MKSLLQVSSISKRYGDKLLFENATVTIGEKQKVGVVGRNGAGKSTLFKIIVGEEDADEGLIVKSEQLKLSYLEQKDPFLIDETLIGFLVRYSGKDEWQCAATAARFHLKGETLHKKIESLSGGYRMRVKLTAMLLGEPNFLILDEPTNYLDLTTLLLLEKFLKNFSGALMIISHDREFLKRTCDHTLEVESGKLFLFPGGIEEYLEFKISDTEQKIRMNRNIESRKKELESFVERFRAKASKASQAQSRMKMLNKLQSVEIEHPVRSVKIRIPKVGKKNGIALKLTSLSIGYKEHKVASNIDLYVERGEKVAVLGDNGQGKTTFLKTVAGELNLLSGEVKWADGVKIGYYAQHVYQSLSPKEDILSYLEKITPSDVSRQDILNMAGAFLFSGDDVKKSISVLSGGERARVSLAGLLLQGCHVLLLDEPTNHLDFETVEALGDALADYEGTLFFVSHDRTFVNQIAKKILEVKDNRVELFPGNYEEYLFRLELQSQEEEMFVANFPSNMQKSENNGNSSKSEKLQVSRYRQKKDMQSELNRLQTLFKKTELEMQALEKEKEELLKWMMENPSLYSREKNESLTQITNRLAQMEEEWLVVQESMESLRLTLASMS